MYNIVFTMFLTVVFCTAIALMLLSAVAFIQDKRFYSSAPKEAQAVIEKRPEELFPGARAIGWVLFTLSLLIASGVMVFSIWDGVRNNFTFLQFFLRFVFITTVYKLCDMILIDYFLLLKFGFFQYYYPEAKEVMKGRKYGFNIKSQLCKLLVIFPAISALLAWICSAL
ncbi:MAG: hypothetical protein IJ225_02935 [Solobacterium sp.]|nr:hypothetical protein [Solobacterium sp.]